MAETYDVILKGGVVVNHDGESARDLGIKGGTIAAIGKVGRAHHRRHCESAFFVGGTRENVSELPELERLPGRAGIKVFMGSSTGTLLVEDDERSAAP